VKFKGIPNRLVRISKIRPHLVRKVPKSIRFDKDGIFETENPYLIKRLSTKFEILEENDGLQEKGQEETKVNILEKQEVETSDDDIRKLAKDAKIKHWHNKSIERLLKELEELEV